LSFASIGLGMITSIVFLVSVNEKKLTDDCLKMQKVMKELTIEENRKIISIHPEILLDTHDTLEKKDHYQSGVYEVQPQSSLSEIHSLGNEDLLLEKKSFCSEEFSWKEWFKLPAFYLYGFVYMGSRVLVNVQSVKVL